MGKPVSTEIELPLTRLNNTRARLRFFVGLVIAAIFVSLILSHLQWQSVQAAMALAQPHLLLLGLVSLGIGFFTRILRWWWMLRSLEPDLPLNSCIRPFLVSLALNNTFPLRAGDVFRIVGFRHELRSPPMRVLGTLVIERLLDLLVLLVFLFAGLVGLASQQFSLLLLKASFSIGAVCVISLLSLILFPDRLHQGLNWVVHRRWLRQRNLSIRLEKWLEQLFGSLSLLRSPALSLQLLALSFITWTFEGGMFAAVAWSLQIDAKPIGPWFALATGTLATLIPSSPGYIGTFDYFAMLGLVSYGAQQEVAVIFAILVHLFLWLPVTLVGGVLFFAVRKQKIVLPAEESVAPTPPLEATPIHFQGTPPHVIILGAGFTGLAAAYELTRLGARVTVLERDAEVGGLAGSFEVNGERLEKFYHHWFTNDKHVMDLVRELQAEDRVIYRATRTGIYYANNFFKLSSPLDLLKFKPLNWFNRIRLGLLVLQARRVKDWKQLESMTAKEWLLKLCGQEVYKVVWEPLLRGKFGPFAEEISAVWFWNKLKLRGGSRSKDGGEMLAYYRGGFAALAERIAAEVESRGGQIKTNASVKGLVVEQGRFIGVQTENEVIQGEAVIATPALPIVARWLEPHVSKDYTNRLRQIQYLANVCLVLELDRSLSKTYWLNVNDPNFPFVGVIEHTNFEPTETYGGRHIVYLSKYLPETAELYQMTNEEALNYSIPHLQRMFPEFDRNWIIDYHFWRAQYSQPIVVRYYSDLIPFWSSPLAGFYISTMAQIYPEDRGTNYAIREGRQIAQLVFAKLKQVT